MQSEVERDACREEARLWTCILTRPIIAIVVTRVLQCVYSEARKGRPQGFSTSMNNCEEKRTAVEVRRGCLRANAG